MIIKCATKRNANGYRKYICIDTDRKQYALEPRHWFCREDFIEISATDRKKMIDKCDSENYLVVDYL